MDDNKIRRNMHLHNAILRWSEHCRWAQNFCITNRIPYNDYFPKNQGEEKFLYSRIHSYRSAHNLEVKTSARKYKEVDVLIKRCGFGHWLN